MQTIKFGIAAAAATALLSTLAPVSAGAASAEHGKAVFIQKGCWQCHGTQGQGAVTGPRLAPDPIPLEAIDNFIRNSTGPMPPYRREILSDADLADIYAYLQSIPKPPDVKDVPLLNQWASKPK
jgi:ubiquinol-cytochrome c reductase cytochrome c subunit